MALRHVDRKGRARPRTPWAMAPCGAVTPGRDSTLPPGPRPPLARLASGLHDPRCARPGVTPAGIARARVGLGCDPERLDPSSRGPARLESARDVATPTEPQDDDDSPSDDGSEAFGAAAHDNSDETSNRAEFEAMGIDLMKTFAEAGFMGAPVFPGMTITPIAIYREVPLRAKATKTPGI